MSRLPVLSRSFETAAGARQPGAKFQTFSYWRDLTSPRCRYLYRRSSFEAIARGSAGHNVLYSATRNIAQPLLLDDGTTWCCDLVEFPGGPLPTGEYGRSLGHWNLSDETESFYVDAGAATMLYGWRDSPVFRTTIGGGSILVLPPAAWHVTYCTTTAATTITNIYSRKYSSPAQHESASKYAERTSGLPRVTLACVRGEPTLVGPDRAKSLLAGKDFATHLTTSPIGVLSRAFAQAAGNSALRSWLLHEKLAGSRQ
jgi:hypothetical protein